MRRKRWWIESGQVVIGDGAQLVSRGRNFRAYEVDLSTKYAEVLGYGGHGRVHMVMLTVGEHTLHYSTDTELPTTVYFRLPRTWLLRDSWCGYWTTVTHCARYTLYVTFYRRSLWSRLDLAHRLWSAWYRLRYPRRTDE